MNSEHLRYLVSLKQGTVKILVFCSSIIFTTELDCSNCDMCSFNYEKTYHLVYDPGYQQNSYMCLLTSECKIKLLIVTAFIRMECCEGMDY